MKFLKHGLDIDMAMEKFDACLSIIDEQQMAFFDKSFLGLRMSEPGLHLHAEVWINQIFSFCGLSSMISISGMICKFRSMYLDLSIKEV